MMTTVVPLAFALQEPRNIGGLDLLDMRAASSQVRQKSAGTRGPAVDDLGPIPFFV